MALIICVDCGGKLSDKAEACPHCGCPVEASVAKPSAPAARTQPLPGQKPTLQKAPPPAQSRVQPAHPQPVTQPPANKPPANKPLANKPLAKNALRYTLYAGCVLLVIGALWLWNRYYTLQGSWQAQVLGRDGTPLRLDCLPDGSVLENGFNAGTTWAGGEFDCHSQTPKTYNDDNNSNPPADKVMDDFLKRSKSTGSPLRFHQLVGRQLPPSVFKQNGWLRRDFHSSPKRRDPQVLAIDVAWIDVDHFDLSPGIASGFNGGRNVRFTRIK